ncbi:MAG: DUF4193 family protein [Acidimicrobiia bacterium]
MADDEFEENEAEPEEPDLDEEELDEDDEFASPTIGDDDDEDILVGDVEAEIPEGAEAETDDDEDESLDLEEDVHPDDVEEPLDVLLLERTSSGLLDEDEYDQEDDDVDIDERAEPGSRIPPKRPGEFVCRSCFLVKHPSQLADHERVLCADCV